LSRRSGVNPQLTTVVPQSRGGGNLTRVTFPPLAG